jgi:pyrroline-5-carboxylate reductase
MHGVDDWYHRRRPAGWRRDRRSHSRCRPRRPNDLSLSYRKQRPDRFPGAFWTPDNQALADRSDVMILSVRPADWTEVKVNAEGKLRDLRHGRHSLWPRFANRHKTRRVFRCLPNAAAEVSKSYTPWIATKRHE